MNTRLITRSFTQLTLIAASVALLASCASPGGSSGALAPVAGTVKLTVLHTNDHHGRFWKNGDGEYGLAARKTLVDQVRAEVKAAGGHTLLLDSGDVNTGVPESDTQDAEPDFKGMKLLGYDAMALGNHEFDKPLATLDKQIGWAGFPLLSANIYRDGKRAYKPYEVFERGGLKVAVLGLTTEDTRKLTDPGNTGVLDFRKPADEAAKLVPELRNQAHVVIATTHMGHYTDGKSGVNAPGDVELARAVKGLDMIVGGHSQNPVCMLEQLRRNDAYQPGTDCKPDQQNGTWIVQAHEWGKYVGRADFEYSGGQFKLVKYTLLPVNLKKTVKAADGKDQKVFVTQEIKEDEALVAFLKPYQDRGRAALDVIVGSSDGKLEGDRAVVRAKPTNLGVFIASVMRERAKADVGIMNSGGIRDSLPAGPLAYKDVLKVQPFGNMLSYVDFSGKELMDYLNAAAKMTAGSGAFAQFSGVKLEIEAGAVKSAQLVRAGGKLEAIDPAKTYRLALNNFQANGGDGYPKLSTHPGFVNTGFVDAAVMREHLAKSGIKTAEFEPGEMVVRK
jgi:5'-nucleotidase / UDP-sugar diphosphatase